MNDETTALEGAPAERLDKLLWEAIDYAGSHPVEARDVDPRTWHHLLTYSTHTTFAPDELREELAAAEKSVAGYMAERNQARDRVRQLRAELDAHTPVMAAAAESIESLLSLIRRNAPELSGKVIGWAERDLAALRAISPAAASLASSRREK